MVQHCSATWVMNALLNGGLSHQNSGVRKCTAQHLAEVVEKILWLSLASHQDFDKMAEKDRPAKDLAAVLALKAKVNDTVPIMSIDFDSVALKTQQEEDEYDQEDYAREQELHQLLTDLPDDMLEDSRDTSSPEPDGSVCSDRSHTTSTQHAWDRQSDWTVQRGVLPTREKSEGNYEQGSFENVDDTYINEGGQFNGRHSQPLPHSWAKHQEQDQDYAYDHDRDGYAYPSMGTEGSTMEGGLESDQYRLGEYHHSERPMGELGYSGQCFQHCEAERSGGIGQGHYKVSYNQYQPASPSAAFDMEVVRHDGHYEQLQRDFLDSAHNSADQQQLAQLRILNKTQLRQIEDLEQKLEDCRRSMRYLEHQSAIVKDEKEGLAVTLRESGLMLEEAKEGELQLQGTVKGLQLQVQTVTDREQEAVKKLRVAEAAVDSLQQQMTELCRSETLSRAREQHDRDMAAILEQHQGKVLALQQKLDAQSRAMEEQAELSQTFREQLRQLERLREEEKLERAGVVNTLTQCLEESQQQCANLLQMGTVQEISQLRVQLQQMQSAKNMSESMNQSLQEELSDLKEQITLYESAVKFGVISLDSNGDWDNQLSDSYVELGIKKVNWKTGRVHSGPLPAAGTMDGLTNEELVSELKAEVQRFLGSLKAKRQTIVRLQQELRQAQAQTQELRKAQELQAQLDGDCKEASLENRVRAASLVTAPPGELCWLQKERLQLQGCVEKLEKQNKELKQSEEKVRAANLELCTKMREMIQEFDQEKQEAVERYNRAQQQYRDDVVTRVQAELAQEHATELDRLRAQYQQRISELESKVAGVSGEMAAVQECYISVCREKDALEGTLHIQMEEERKSRESELKAQMEVEREESLARLQAHLETQHQESEAASRVRWEEEKEAELEQRVAVAKTAWEEEHAEETRAAVEQVEGEWSQRLEEALRRAGGEERSTQTESKGSEGISQNEMASRLANQRLALLREADRVKTQALEEAVRHAELVLGQKHLEDIAQQVEKAVSDARGHWLQELASLPEYKARLQAERQGWEKQHEQDIAKQISSVLRAVEEKGQEAQQRELKELEAREKAKVRSLEQQLEQGRQEASRLQAELDRVRQEEVGCQRAQSERDRAELEPALKLAGEEADQRRDLAVRQALEDQREQHWTEVLAEVRSALREVRGCLTHDAKWTDQDKQRRPGSGASGELRACLLSEVKDLIDKAEAQARQEWEKSNEERVGRMLREAKDRHEKETNRILKSVWQQEGRPACGKACAEKLQKLQGHLEKACHQLQQTVRDNKAAMQRLKEDHKEAIRKQREESQKRLNETRRSFSRKSSQPQASESSHSQQNLQAGLEAMKEQYLKAVAKIRGDMLRYLQESKERAAEMIRVEVLRERQDTARRMRRYYLTCLQELLEDCDKAQGAEKKIMHAASKLAGMAKWLENPVSKRRSRRGLASQGLSKLESPNKDLLKMKDETPKACSDQSQPTRGTVSQKPEHMKRNPLSLALLDRDRRPGTEGSKLLLNSGKGKTVEENDNSDCPSNPARCLLRAPLSQVSPLSTGGGTTSVANVTLRNPGRETPREVEGCTVKSKLGAILVVEPPVRDGGQSDWRPVRGLTWLGKTMEGAQDSRTPSVTSISQKEDASDSDLSSYQDVPKSLPKPGTKHCWAVETVPGSEGARLRQFCSRSLFSELKACQQQDSGFDSPLSVLHK